MLRHILQLSERVLRRKLSDGEIEKAFKRLGPASVSRAASSPDELCVCALQMEARFYPNVSAWLRDLNRVLEKACMQGARLVCLPELYGMIPFFFSASIRAAIRLAGRALQSPQKGEGKEGGRELYELLELFDFVQPAYEKILSGLSERNSVWLSGGTSFVADKGHVYNRHLLFSPQGKKLAQQDKIHLTPEESALGLSCSDTISIVDTAIGRIALSVCMDATYFETSRVAKRRGADYMIVPIGDMAEFSPWLALRGAQLRVSETGLPAVKAALVSGKNFPVLFSGKAGIYFPLESGVASVESPEARGEHMVLARFSLSQVRAARNELFLRQNDAFDRKYYLELTSAHKHG